MIEIFERPAWQTHAACRGLTEVFYSDHGELNSRAKEICKKCLVRKDCIEYALRLPLQIQSHGVWGGTAEPDRRRIRKVRNQRRKLTVQESDQKAS